jgi:serine/threonine protein phosphatase 1
MSTIAVGDIHGHRDALADLLDQLAPAVGAGDTVVFLGDYIDRGPRSRDCVDAILAFRSSTSADVVCLCGNHEDWLLKTMRNHRRHSWLTGMEAWDTIRSYSIDAERALRDAVAGAGLGFFLGMSALPYEVFFDAVPKAHLEFFRGLGIFHESADCLCVHGGLDPAIACVADQPRDSLIWGTDAFQLRYDGAATVVYGHWNNAEVGADRWPRPRILGHTIGVDTIAHGVLTAVRLPDRQVFQSARYEAYPG